MSDHTEARHRVVIGMLVMEIDPSKPADQDADAYVVLANGDSSPVVIHDVAMSHPIEAMVAEYRRSLLRSVP